jgi:hypothetical protein
VALAHPGHLVWRAGRPRRCCTQGRLTTLSPTPPPGRVVVGVEERGPASAQSLPGRERGVAQPPTAAEAGAATAAPVASRQAAGPSGRATPALDDGRRGQGARVGACTPAEGEALTAPDARRAPAHSVDFRARGEAWMAPDGERV